ncbi:hypothetical protein BZL43_07330 [Pseudomonas sp. PICF141]|nr:hypothetical protein BZL43_07330 [Pseudomonas sp. PICF141]
MANPADTTFIRRKRSNPDSILIVPTLCVGMSQWTLCVRFERDAERPGLHSHAQRGNDHQADCGR